jgi:Uma2 family endonuclease
VDPPYIVIEILSLDDTMGKLQARLDDYLGMGIENVWVIDPETKRGWRAALEGLLEQHNGILSTTDSRVAMPLADLFSSDSFMP